MIQRIVSERYVLACILNIPESVWDIYSVVSIRDFTVPLNKFIFLLAKDIVQEGITVDEVTLFSKFTPQIFKSLNENPNDVINYIKILKNSPVRSENLPYHIDVLKRASTARQMINLFDKVSSELKEAEDLPTVSEMIGKCESRLVDLGITNESIVKTHHVADGLREEIENAINNKCEVKGFRTGFWHLDHKMNGLLPQQLTVVAARPKVGKTTLLLNWARHLAVESQVPVLMLDTEMPTKEIATRLVAQISQVPEVNIITGNLASQEDANAVENAINILEKSPIYHIYMPNWTFDMILAYTKRFKVKHDIKVLFFDYIKMPDTFLGKLPEFQALGVLTSDLKNKIAGELEIPVVTAVQQNRMAVLSDTMDTTQIAGSDRILHYCNYLFFLNRKTQEEREACGYRSNLSLVCLASRNMDSGYRIDLMFRKNILKIEEVGDAGYEEEIEDLY